MFEDEGDDSRRFDTAQICLNGHIVNRMADDHPESNADYCKDCGEKTITRCPSCNANIRGYKHILGVAYGDTSPAPGFCHSCGKSYPWTRVRIDAAKALAAEIEELSESDRILLQSSIDDLVGDTPRTNVAVVRFSLNGAKVTGNPKRF